jgi:hypothetical protein
MKQYLQDKSTYRTHRQFGDVGSTVYVLAMVGHLKNVCSTFAEMPNRISNVEFTTVSPTIANTMLAVVPLSIQKFYV